MSDEFRYDYDEHMQRKRERARATAPLCPSLVHSTDPLCVCGVEILPKGLMYRVRVPGRNFLSPPLKLKEDREVRLLSSWDDLLIYRATDDGLIMYLDRDWKWNLTGR